MGELTGSFSPLTEEQIKAEREQNNKTVHDLRLKIAEETKRASVLAERIGRGAGGREVSLTITKLQEAKMWLGKVLEVNGEPVVSDEPTV